MVPIANGVVKTIINDLKIIIALRVTVTRLVMYYIVFIILYNMYA